MLAKEPLRTAEFVPLTALLISLVALSVDAMLPALPAIGRDLKVTHQNDTQLVITALFIGLGLGQMIFGPLSDRIGRRPAIIAGLVIFIIGSLVSLLANSFAAMIAGRMMQGIGASGPRIVTVALVRDQYTGQQMARIMSFIMAVFILVPAVAPLLGQTIMLYGGWRAIFAAFSICAALALIWFALRQPETLDPAHRRSLSMHSICDAVSSILRIRSTMGYTLATGFVFTPFVAYLSSSQLVFQQSYDTGTLFPVYFGGLALAIGAGALSNDRLLIHFPMHRISTIAAAIATATSTIALVATFFFDGLPPLWLYIAYLSILFICMGTMFGNLNALALEPLGHLAGIGSALVISIATLLSTTLAWAVASTYDGTIYFLVASFAVFGLLQILAMQWAVGDAKV